MDLRKIKKLIELLEESALAEMEITEGDNTIRLSRADARHAYPPTTAPPTAAVAAPASALAEASSTTPPTTAAGILIKSPLVGTFFDSSSPDAAPYVSVGSIVGKGDTLCLIEAMKTFNQLDAEVAGRISVIHKHNGEPVEYGEPLFVIVPADDAAPGDDRDD
ncbi:MAG: acetyl-CoA carboxylase biotin carboxyl carrier protein [bacterium]